MRGTHDLHSGWLIGVAVFALAIPLSYAPAAIAAVDCSKSPTYLRKIPGGQELVFHPECEPPALAARPAMKALAGAPAFPSPEPTAAGAGDAARAAQPASDGAAMATAEAAPKRRSGPQSAERVRVQGYTRVRRQY